jgi:hypothetical protein
VRAGLLASILVACVGLVTCGGASCVSILSYEPPHPQWQMAVADALRHPERATVKEIRDADYDVSIYPAGDCTLVVKDGDGNILGRSKGGLCLVGLTGRAGQSWTFEATSSSPDAEIQLAVANPVFPKPLGRIALGGAVVFVLAVAGALIAAVRSRARGAPPARVDPTFLSPERQREVHGSDVAEQRRRGRD